MKLADAGQLRRLHTTGTGGVHLPVILAQADPLPVVAGASYPAFACCLCTMGDEHRHVLISQPLYTRAVLCRGCQHMICYDHQVQVCRLCQACCWEKHGSHFEGDGL